MAFDLKRISKALAGGITGAVTAAGGTGIVYVNLPPNVLPANVYTWVPIINAIVGFIVGFFGVYLAPANTITTEQKVQVLTEAGRPTPGGLQ